MSTSETNAFIWDTRLQMKAAVNSIERTDENATMLDAAKARIHEFTALVTMANGEPWKFRKELRPISQQMNETILAIEARLGAEITADDKGDVEEQMAIREDGLFRLDAARINSVLALVHLSAALDASTPPSPPLKAV